MRRITVLLGLLFMSGLAPVQAAFTSLYAFGDGVSTTTNNTSPGVTNYYGQSFCNGRVWVEVLAQWQGLAYDSNKNWSYFGHYSDNLTNDVDTFTAPGDVGTALFLVWINNADFVYALNDPSFGPPYNSSKLPLWTNYLNISLSNHTTAIQTLYNKGVRTLVMPNVVDLSNVPNYSSLVTSNKTFIRQRIVEYNLKFTGILSNSMAALPGLKIHQPDTFLLFENLMTNAASFGLTNPGIDAIDDLYDGLGNPTFAGPGASYIFWDFLHPTAKFQMLIAERAQQMLAPLTISKITSVGVSNKLDFLNLPVGRNGVVESSTNFLNWTTAATVTVTNPVQSIFVPVTTPRNFYRLRLPFVWIYP